MPSVFRRRFLSYQDVLDPSEMSQDFKPFSELLSGNVDCDNLKASSLKSVDPGSSVGHRMATMATCVPYYSEVVCHPRFSTAAKGEGSSGSGGTHDIGVSQPNFMFPDKSNELLAVSDENALRIKTDSQGFIKRNLQTISSGSGWVPLAGGVDMIPRSSTFSDSTYDSEREVNFKIQTIGTTGSSKLWINAFVQYVRNGFGWSGQETPAHIDDSNYDAIDHKPAVRPLNIFFVPGPDEEAYFPSRCGLHHLSQGYTSANVQFAIRLNGQVLEETITGKRFEQERSSIGARHQKTRERGANPDTSEATYGTKPSIYKLPGPAQKQVRATALGPEVLGVRLGTIVSVGPGPHTIEVVARRFSMTSKNTNIPFDVVGVHNRQLFVLELPVERSIDASHTTNPGRNTFESEEPLLNVSPAFADVAAVANNLNASNIRPGSLRQEHLQSRVVAKDFSVTAIPDVGVFHIHTTSSVFSAKDNWAYWRSLSTLHSQSAATHDEVTGVGWTHVGGSSGADHLFVSNSNSDNHRVDIDDDSVLIVLVDVQHVRIKANGNVPLNEHLLDLFAGYAIGHREAVYLAGGTGGPGDSGLVTGDGSNSNWRIDQASRMYVNSWNSSGRDNDYQISADNTGRLSDVDNRAARKGVAVAETEDNFVNVSLMFVVADDQRRRDPDGNFWKIGDVGLFYCGGAAAGLHGAVNDGPRWVDYYWDRGNDFHIVKDTKMRSYRASEEFEMNPPTISVGRGTMSLLHIKK